MKTRSKATLTLRAMLARRYGFGAVSYTHLDVYKRQAQGGPRYDASMTPEERKSFENGIWLCQSCSKLIDTDITRYPKEPVSYTHLDVYKRQAQQRTDRCWQGYHL